MFGLHVKPRRHMAGESSRLEESEARPLSVRMPHDMAPESFKRIDRDRDGADEAFDDWAAAGLAKAKGGAE